MTMNKQSNTYTLLYIIAAVVIVGSALAFTAMSLRDKQQANANADKMKQILYSVHLDASSKDVKQIFDSHIVRQYAVNSKGEIIKSTDNPDDTGIFNTDIAVQSKLPADERILPVFVCRLDDGSEKHIMPVYGNGLWGAIWGYVSVDSNGSTIYGAYFSHASETPGLGAEIEKPEFQDRFPGLNLFKDGRFLPIAVVKSGQKPAGNEDYVDGISGGTITSKGVAAMLDNCLKPYEAYLKNLRND